MASAPEREKPDDAERAMARLTEAVRTLKAQDQPVPRRARTTPKRPAKRAKPAVHAVEAEPVADEAPDDGLIRHRRMVEAILFAAAEPVDTAALRRRLPQGADVSAILASLQHEYADRGINLVRVAGKWRFQTAPDMAPLLREERVRPRKLSQAALETLAVIAYHQPVTRAEIEAVRGVAAAKGTLDVLMDVGWVRPKGRRRAPGRPTVYGTTEGFLAHFGLEDLSALPGKAELKAAGLLDGEPPDGFEMPDPARAEEAADIEPIDDADPTFHTDFLSPDADAAE